MIRLKWIWRDQLITTALLFVIANAAAYGARGLFPHTDWLLVGTGLFIGLLVVRALAIWACCGPRALWKS